MSAAKRCPFILEPVGSNDCCKEGQRTFHLARVTMMRPVAPPTSIPSLLAL
jgi:hypothetical protein